MTYIKLLIYIAFLGCVVACSQTEKRLEPEATSKHAIDLSGYAHPNVAFIQEHLTAMEKTTPFDGIVFRVDPVNGFDANTTPVLLDSQLWSDSSLDFNTLASIPWKKFQHNFIRLDTTDGSYDPEWFNDVRWQHITSNMKVFAKIAKTSKSKGLVFDPEPYGYNPWDYSLEKYPDQTFDEVYNQVKERGGQVMTAWQSEYSNITVLMLFGLGIVRVQTDYYDGDQSQAEWGLWGAFIEGMLEVINSEATLIEGNEGSYYYKNAADFEGFRDYKAGARELLEDKNRAKYDEQMKVAYAVYVDNVLNLWKSPRFFGYYLASDEERSRYAEHNFYHALKNTDEYVWVYSENMDWWGTKGQGVTVPDGLLEMMQRAKEKVLGNQELGFSIAEAVDKATFEFDRRVFVDGYIYKNGLNFYTRVYSGPPIGLEEEDSACNTYNNHPDYWYYDCTFPYGWTGALTPSGSDATFDPVKRDYTNLTESKSDQNFNARP